MNTMRARLKYGLICLSLLVVEILIAKFGSGILRGYVGDVLVIPLIYFFLRALVWPRHSHWAVYGLPFLTYLLGWVAELLQALHLIDHLGIDVNSPLGIALGGVPDWKDGLCYYLGLVLIGVFLAVETHWFRGHRGAIRREERRARRAHHAHHAHRAGAAAGQEAAEAAAGSAAAVTAPKHASMLDVENAPEEDQRWFYPIAVCIQWTWGILQTMGGFAVFLWYIRCPHTFYKGVVRTVWTSGAGLSMGMFIFTPCEPAADDQSKHAQKERAYCERVAIHEYGHTFQSLLLGPFYLFVIGLPSIVWAGSKRLSRMRREKHIPYTHFFCEHWASSWGEKVTKEEADWT